jgi:hypothetical protein
VNISEVNIQYDRNGSGGEGSFLVFFRVTSEEYEGEAFVGTLWQSKTSNYYQAPEEGEEEDYQELMIHRVADIMRIGVDYLDNKAPTKISIGAFRSTDYFLPELRPYLDDAYRRYFYESFFDADGEHKPNYKGGPGLRYTPFLKYRKDIEDSN